MTDFFKKLVYSACNEDSYSEAKGLDLKKDDHALCLTGSGARALDLICLAPAKVTSVDFNACQSHLLELKVAAIKAFSYEKFLSFLGVSSDEDRYKSYRKIRASLSPEARKYWDSQQKMVVKGVLYQGQWERYMKLLVPLLGTKKKVLEKLFSCETLAEQEKVWLEEWEGKFWNSYLKVLSSRPIWKYVLREPGIYFVPKSFSIHGYLKERFRHIARTSLFRENHYINLLVKGQYSKESLPIHLQEKYFTTMRAHLKNLSIKTMGFQEALEKMPKTFNAFSLSDFSSYADKKTYDKSWNLIIQAAKPGSRFVERSFLVKHEHNVAHLKQLQLNKSLAESLRKKDDTFIYDFKCGVIKPEKAS